MLIPSRFEGYAAGRRVYPGGKGGGHAPPPPDPRMYEALAAQVKQGDRLLDYVHESMQQNQGYLSRQEALNSRVIEQQMGLADRAANLADKAEGRADAQFKFYQSEGQPLLSKAFKDAQQYDSESNINAARGRAAADVSQQFDNANQQAVRTLMRMGVNPNSGRFMALNNQLQMQKALGTAGAMNQAGEQRRTQGVAMRQQAGNLAQGLPAQSMGFSGSGQGFAGQAGGFGASAAGVGAQGMNSRLSATGQGIQGMSAVGNLYGGAAQGYGNLYGQQMQGYQIQQNAAAQSAAGFGSLVGTLGSAGILAGVFRDGGQIGRDSGGVVRGPGTGTSDSVPAVNVSTGQNIRLSNGEYVVPADVVRAKGVEFFDKLKSKYHVPVNLRSA